MAITRRNFPGILQAELEKWLRWCLEEIATGKVQQAWNDGETSASKWIDSTLPPERRRDLILNDLGILAPATYPPRDTVRVERTVPRYL